MKEGRGRVYNGERNDQKGRREKPGKKEKLGRREGPAQSALRKRFGKK